MHLGHKLRRASPTGNPILALFGAGVDGAYYDSLLSPLYSNVARSVLATTGGIVRVMDDVSGNNRHFVRNGTYLESGLVQREYFGRKYAVASSAAAGDLFATSDVGSFYDKPLTIIGAFRGETSTTGIETEDSIGSLRLAVGFDNELYGAYTFPWSGSYVYRYGRYQYGGHKIDAISDLASIPQDSRDTPMLIIMTFYPWVGGVVAYRATGAGALSQASFWTGTPGDFLNRAGPSSSVTFRGQVGIATLNDIWVYINKELTATERSEILDYWQKTFVV